MMEWLVWFALRKCFSVRASFLVFVSTSWILSEGRSIGRTARLLLLEKKLLNGREKAVNMMRDLWLVCGVDETSRSLRERYCGEERGITRLMASSRRSIAR